MFCVFHCLLYLGIPELQGIVSGVKSGNDEELIQLAFREVLTCPEEKIYQAIDSLLLRFSKLSKYLKLHRHKYNIFVQVNLRGKCLVQT